VGPSHQCHEGEGKRRTARARLGLLGCEAGPVELEQAARRRTGHALRQDEGDRQVGLGHQAG